MICPLCGEGVSEEDVTWVRGVAGHFECHRRRQSATTRFVLGAIACGVLAVGGFVGAMVWFSRGSLPK